MKEGWLIVQRSAGSHSPIDIFALNPTTCEILFVQSKSDFLEESKAKKIIRDLEWINTIDWKVRFELR